MEIAVDDGRFTTLVTALQAAELDTVLAGEGPFTVFAPTDDAFGKLPEGTVEGLLADIPGLKDVLLYHVVSGNVQAKDVLNLESADTLQGSSFAISVTDGKVMVNESEVIITDIEAVNGTIHVIDTVLLPPTPVAKAAQPAKPVAAAQSAQPAEPAKPVGVITPVSKRIMEIAIDDGRFTTLVTALQAAELDTVLAGEGPFTVFAPTDDAFGKLPEGTVEGLLADIPGLKDVLLYHVVSGNVQAKDVLNLESADTLQGSSFAISVTDGKVMVNESEVIITDIEAVNGTIHVIDAVLLPTTTG